MNLFFPQVASLDGVPLLAAIAFDSAQAFSRLCSPEFNLRRTPNDDPALIRWRQGLDRDSLWRISNYYEPFRSTSRC